MSLIWDAGNWDCALLGLDEKERSWEVERRLFGVGLVIVVHMSECA